MAGHRSWARHRPGGNPLTDPGLGPDSPGIRRTHNPAPTPMAGPPRTDNFLVSRTATQQVREVPPRQEIKSQSRRAIMTVSRSATNFNYDVTDSFNKEDNDTVIKQSWSQDNDTVVKDSWNQDNDTVIKQSWSQDNDTTLINDSFNEDNDTTVYKNSFNQDNDGVDNKGGVINDSVVAGDDIDRSFNSDDDTYIDRSFNTDNSETNIDASDDDVYYTEIRDSFKSDDDRTVINDSFKSDDDVYKTEIDDSFNSSDDDNYTAIKDSFKSDDDVLDLDVVRDISIDL
jgi:hypothetical protein